MATWCVAAKAEMDLPAGGGKAYLDICVTIQAGTASSALLKVDNLFSSWKLGTLFEIYSIEKDEEEPQEPEVELVNKPGNWRQ